jgi:hypothetical protein
VVVHGAQVANVSVTKRWYVFFRCLSSINSLSYPTSSQLPQTGLELQKTHVCEPCRFFHLVWRWLYIGTHYQYPTPNAAGTRGKVPRLAVKGWQYNGDLDVHTLSPRQDVSTTFCCVFHPLF